MTNNLPLTVYLPLIIGVGCLGSRIQILPAKDKLPELLAYSESIRNEGYESVMGQDGPLGTKSPKKFLQEKSSGSNSQVMIGIVVENYSRFRLVQPWSSGKNSCGKVRELSPPMAIKEGAYGFFAADNEEYFLRSVCGALAWRIEHPNGSPLLDETSDFGYRLVMVFNVPYSISCGANFDRDNQHSFLIAKVRVNKTGDMKYPNTMDGYYDTFLQHGPINGWIYSSNSNTTNIALYDKERFLVKSSMEKGCKPILTVQFMSGPNFKELLFFHKPEATPHSSIDTYVFNGFEQNAFIICVVGIVIVISLVMIIFAAVSRSCRAGSPEVRFHARATITIDPELHYRSSTVHKQPKF